MCSYRKGHSILENIVWQGATKKATTLTEVLQVQLQKRPLICSCKEVRISCINIFPTCDAYLCLVLLEQVCK